MSIMELPETFQNQKLEVIILPIEECEYTEKDIGRIYGKVEGSE